MENNFTEANLNLAITESVYAIEDISFEVLLTRLFGQNVEAIPFELKTFIHRKFISQHKGLLRHLGKKHIYQQVKSGSSKFINDFLEALNDKDLEEMFDGVPQIQEKLNILMEEKIEKDLLTEFGQYFQTLKNKCAPAEIEEHFRTQLKNCFENGEMSCQIWDALNTWYQNGATLKNFKSFNIQISTGRDICYSKIVEAAKEIKTDNFANIEKITKILDKFLVKPSWKLKEKKLIISGRSIYFSKEIIKLMKKIEKNKIEQIEFYVADCFHLDSDVKLPGINFIITGKKAYIWGKRKIDLSGSKYE